MVPDANFTPYAAAGLGVLSGNADVENVTDLVDDDTSTVFGFNFGGGVKTAMNDNWGLRPMSATSTVMTSLPTTGGSMAASRCGASASRAARG